jgi:hypothetical protein
MKYRCILFILFIVFISCKREFKIVFPDTVRNTVETYLQEYKYLIIVYVDSSECTQCALSHLTQWKRHGKELSECNTGVLFVIQNSDEQAVLKVLKTVEIIFPFVFDKGKEIKTNNKIFKSISENVFVIDRNLNTIFLESPVTSRKRWNMFRKKIDKHYEKAKAI